jgi:hypothetical protein
MTSEPGAHVRLEPQALSCGRVCLSAAMEHGFVGPLDIPADAFHPDLQAVAQTIRAAREAGATEFADIILHLVQTTQPGDDQNNLRAAIAGVSEEPAHSPEKLGAAAAIVRQYDIARRRQHLLWKLNAANERDEPIGEILKQIAEIEAGRDASTPGQRAAFDFARADQLGGVSEAFDFVEGTLTDGGASVLYGPSNSGKTFWIVDLGAAVAAGRRFRGELEVDYGAVIYIALEGSRGARNRMAALYQEGILKPGDPFYLIFSPVSLLEPGHADQLAQTVAAIAKETGVPVKLVIIDTMARAMAGGDENSGKDMTAAVSSIDAVRAATGAHVCVVHHCGKDETKGARGHSSLRAAVDTEIEVTRSEGNGVSTVRVTKQRDLQIGDPMPFTLKVIELGTDRRGKPITSCVVQHESASLASQPGRAGRKPICTADDMLAFLPAASAKDWLERVKEDTGLGSTQFYAHKKLLTQAGRIRMERGTGRILPAQEMALPL